MAIASENSTEGRPQGAAHASLLGDALPFNGVGQVIDILKLVLLGVEEIRQAFQDHGRESRTMHSAVVVPEPTQASGDGLGHASRSKPSSSSSLPHTTWASWPKVFSHSLATQSGSCSRRVW